MSVQTTYPGVYVLERPSGSHAITGVSTSLTAFVGAARKGPGDTPVPVSSFADYLRQFGDVMDTAHPMGHAVGQFFVNGGAQAVVVRALGAGAAAGTLALPAVNGLTVTLRARSRGAYANGSGAGTSGQTGLFAEVKPADDFPADRFDLELTEWTPGVAGGPATVSVKEVWRELSMSPASTRYVVSVLNASTLVTAEVTGTPAPAPSAGTSTGALSPASVTVTGKTLRLSVDQGPANDYVLFPAEDPPVSHTLAQVRDHINAPGSVWPVTASVSGGKLVLTSKTSDLNSAVVVGLSGLNDASADLGLGVARGGAEVSASAPYRPAVAAAAPLAGGSDGATVGANEIVSATAGQGMLALDTLDFPRFNLLCLPGVTTADTAPINTALDYCRRQNAFLVIDPAPGLNPAQLKTAANLLRAQGAHGAVYWPRLVTPDGGADGWGPSGAVAGIMARTDTSRGVWKAPAGLEAGIAGAVGLTAPTNDDVSGTLNPLGLNVLRTFPGAGMVVWGARTLAGSDVLSSDSKYVPVRRLTDYIRTSLYLGTQFAVFEPNDPDLWAQLRLAVGGFMRGLFRQGAFQQSEKHAESDSFFVICDSSVNPQTEIDNGRVNVVVGFAPLKPAEFVIITITQLSQAGE
ncbi:phage tail sheath subtilisin-like domain-containing protein [Micromonospora sp. NPDC048930]|uniref:phage tail sheath subtilisin-like domain-containing protein n=1 Tax=Micromonospora sp. NPDC048930 TaxID=3364261 RepID=UPI003716102A